MKKMIFGSIVVAAVLTGCGGGEGSCCDSEASIAVKSEGIPPVATITNLNDDTTVTAGQSLTVNGMTSSDRDGTVTAYKWTIDGVAVSNEENPTFTFNTAGSHEVCLEVTDNANNTSINVECRTVIVGATAVTPPAPVAPTAVISLTDDASPLVIHSDHTFSCANSHDNDTIGTGDEIVSCSWDIQSYKVENGTEIAYRNCSAANTTNHPIFICDQVTRIRATLTVTDNDGQTHSTTKQYTQFAR